MLQFFHLHKVYRFCKSSSDLKGMHKKCHNLFGCLNLYGLSLIFTPLSFGKPEVWKNVDRYGCPLEVSSVHNTVLMTVAEEDGSKFP